jgi:hypothetical protein
VLGDKICEVFLEERHFIFVSVEFWTFLGFCIRLKTVARCEL